MSSTTTNINAKSFVDYYTDWKFPNKTDKQEPARIDCRYDFAVTLSNGSLLTAIGALALGILRVLSPMLALVLVGVSAIVYWQMNEKIHPVGYNCPEGTVEYLSYDVNHKYAASNYFDKEKPWNPVSHNFFNDRILFYRYAPKAPAPKKEDKPVADKPAGVADKGAKQKKPAPKEG
jgi:hypothetical protein